MHVTAIIAAGGLGRRLGGDQPKQLLSVGGRPILERSVAAFLAHPAIDALIVALPQGLVDDPPSYLRPAVLDGAGSRCGSSSNIGIRWQRVRRGRRGERRHRDSRRGASVCSAELIARTIAAAAESGPRSPPWRRATRSEPPAALIGCRKHCRARPSTSPNAAGFRRDVLALAIAEAAARHSTRPTKRPWSSGPGGPCAWSGEATNIRSRRRRISPIAGDCPLGARLARPHWSRRHRLRSAPAGRWPPARPRRRDDSLADRRARPFGRGRRLPRGHRRDPWRRLPGRHRQALSRHRSTVEGRLEPRSAGRAVALVAGQGFEIRQPRRHGGPEKPKIKDHIDAMRAAVAAAIGVDAAQVSIKGNQRRRGRHRPG